jgi:hypothetical protein
MTDIGKKFETIGSIAARAILYMLLFAGVGLLPLLDITTNPFGRDILFTEYSFVQLAQSLALVMGIVAAGLLLYREVLPQLTFLIVVLLSCALVREADSFLDQLVNGLWQAMVTLILVGAVFHLVAQRKAINAQIGWLGGHFSLGLMLSGFVIVTGFARVFGQGALWQKIMGDHYNKSVKYFAEESIELLGYVILTIGVIEFSVAALRQFHHSRVWDVLVEPSSQR